MLYALCCRFCVLKHQFPLGHVSAVFATAYPRLFFTRKLATANRLGVSIGVALHPTARSGPTRSKFCYLCVHG